MKRTNTQVFIELVRAGLWEKEVRLLPFGNIDFEEVFQLAQEQSVLGLVAAGLEHVVDFKIPKKTALQFVGQTMQLEQRNQAMNAFIGKLMEKMRAADIYSVLVKGQGIAQCYERPLWRACGDVDLFLDGANYEKTQALLAPVASSLDPDRGGHHGMTIDGWVVELHSHLHCGLSPRMDKVIDQVQADVFQNEGVRPWDNGGVRILLPSADNDVVLIFTHFLKHFYKGGLGLRQICDWCRLLWTYRDVIDVGLLEKRLEAMRLMTAWKAFAAFVVDNLGMPVEAMPLYSPEAKWSRKARGIMRFVLMSGNFGHNRNQSYFVKYPYLIRKVYSFGRRCGDLLRHARIFPWDSLRFFPALVYNGLRSAARGE